MCCHYIKAFHSVPALKVSWLKFCKHLLSLYMHVPPIAASLIFFKFERLFPRPTPRLEDHPFSVCECFFNILTANPPYWRPPPHNLRMSYTEVMWESTPYNFKLLFCFEVLLILFTQFFFDIVCSHLEQFISKDFLT